jgi:hypothetical protein
METVTSLFLYISMRMSEKKRSRLRACLGFVKSETDASAFEIAWEKIQTVVKRPVFIRNIRLAGKRQHGVFSSTEA